MNELNPKLRAQIKKHLLKLTTRQIEDAYCKGEYPFSAPHYRQEFLKIVEEIIEEKYQTRIKQQKEEK